MLAPKLRKSADKSLSQPGCSHSNTIYNLQLQKTIVLRMQPRHQATLTQPLPCVSQHDVANLHASTHITTPDYNSHAAIPMRSASTDAKTPYDYAHTSTPKAASSHRYTAAKKKRPTDPSRTRRTHEVPFIVACSHFTRKNPRFRAPASSPKHSPCNIMQPFQCDLQPEIPKHTMTTHTQAHPKQLQATVTLRQKKKRPTDPSRTCRTHEVPFIVACSHFTRKNTRFRAPASSPKHSPCNIMQPFQCDLQPEIPKHTITTHTQAHPKQLQATVTLRQKKNDQPTPAAPVAHTRYLSSSPAATLHGKTHGFVLRLPPQHIADATSCSHSNASCNRRCQNTL